MKKIIALIVFTFLTNSALAQTVNISDNVIKFIDHLGNKIISIAAEKQTSESAKKQKIIAEIDRVIDTAWIGHFVLGKNYKDASEAQRTRFMELYRQFMINTYGPKFKNYNGKSFNVISVDQQGGFYVAKCNFWPKDSTTAINVQFRVKERNGKLAVLDFVTEGISLIETQRSEFNSAISEKGMEQFINDLAKRVYELKNKK
ncbi:MAG: ABC transporter substrate-binding protein [Rickettsiales bacterium]|nr:ABC transporter substrate-binding protein [Rickettsiales bacterium]